MPPVKQAATEGNHAKVFDVEESDTQFSFQSVQIALSRHRYRPATRPHSSLGVTAWSSSVGERPKSPRRLRQVPGRVVPGCHACRVPRPCTGAVGHRGPRFPPDSTGHRPVCLAYHLHPFQQWHLPSGKLHEFPATARHRPHRRRRGQTHQHHRRGHLAAHHLPHARLQTPHRRPCHRSR